MSEIDESIQRTLERMQTGWRPTRQEIERLVGLPVEEISGASIDYGVLRHRVDFELGAVSFVEEVLWVAEDQSWALTRDGFYWLS
jgi:hypothetical protein